MSSPVGPAEVETYFAGQLFSANELQAMKLEGLVQEIAPGTYIPAGFSPTSAQRASIVSQVLPPVLTGRALAIRNTAAWIHGFAPSALPWAFALPYTARTTRFHSPHFAISEISDVDWDMSAVGGVVVSGPARTVIDLAAELARGKQRHQECAGIELSAILWLMRTYGLHFGELNEAVREQGLRNGGAILTQLASLGRLVVANTLNGSWHTDGVQTQPELG